ncbi:MAG: RNA polymerase sigma factor [Phycisphaerae bacterium]|nr:MAG: sigma-70 family RNA polymerase sigma factor [Planctomycetia bacterium]GJQ25739.1 MAG: RNA polymerase sigma factor [Phycisphaerae bacterium]
MNSSRGDVKGLWKKYLSSRAIKIRNLLVEHYRPLVHMQAARLAQKLPAQVSYDEICSAGYDGLMEAVQAYDPKHKAKFETFCQQRIHGAVMDWLRALDGQSRTVRSFEKQRMLHKEILDSELGRPPTETELSAHMGISHERFAELSRLSRLGHEVHLSAVQSDDDSHRGSPSGWDVSDVHAVDPSQRISRQMLTDYITRGLNREERLVLVLYYTEGLTMAEIGLVLDLSESRVSQIHKDVIARLRRRFKDEVAELVA